MSGCLYSTAHFNSGRLLEPGRSSLTLGGGRFRSFTFGCNEPGSYGMTSESRDSLGIHCVTYRETIQDSTGGYRTESDTTAPKAFWTSVSSYSIGYRLGILGQWGPFPGADMGLHLEAPTNPATGEFDLRLGLPVPAGIPFHHSLSAGWGIGFWADNSYFLEYAFSHAWGENDLFFNYRATRLATQIPDLADAVDERVFASERRLIHQASAGFRWELPDIAMLPDFLIPQAVLTYPLGPNGASKVPKELLDDRMWNVNLGMGWHFK
ncbi:MAG: hypothetical protein JWP91_1428 [Fibrobacteres bacterium]|nr:hypothetical protein [Fibrobacterota bacterium]